MAKLPVFVNFFAERDPRGANGMDNLSRVLRRDRLISAGKRGSGAPELTPTDGTNFLFGLGTRRAVHAPEIVRELRDTVLVGTYDQQKDIADSIVDIEKAVDHEHYITAGKFCDLLLEQISRTGAIELDNGKVAHVAGVEISDPKSGPAEIQFFLNDTNSTPANPVQVRFSMRPDESLDLPEAMPPISFQSKLLVPGFAFFELGQLLKRNDVSRDPP